MNRAFYIKRNGLLVPDHCGMNPAFLGSWPKPSASGGGGGIIMVTGGQSTTVGTTFNGVFGFKFHPTVNMTLTHGAFQMLTGNSHNHIVYLENGLTGAIIAQTSATAASGSNNSYIYTPFISPPSLVAGTTYALVMDATTGLDSWYSDDATLTTDSRIVITTGVLSSSGPGGALTDNNSGSHGFGQVNGKFTVP